MFQSDSLARNPHLDDARGARQYRGKPVIEACSSGRQRGKTHTIGSHIRSLHLEKLLMQNAVALCVKVVKHLVA